MRIVDGSVTKLNRHDCKRRRPPKQVRCPECGADLGIVPVYVTEGIAPCSTGLLEPGVNGVVIRLLSVRSYDLLIQCSECGANILGLQIEEFYQDPECEFVEDEADGEAVGA